MQPRKLSSYHARRGKLGESLPLAVVAVEKFYENQTQYRREMESKMCQWVWGQLHIPEACGDGFCYSVNDFGSFAALNSQELAASLYFHVLSFGLSVVIQVRDELERNVFGRIALPPPVPASGRRLQLGDRQLGPAFCASPIYGANPFPGGTEWTIAQGDLFKGMLNLKQIHALAEEKVILSAAAGEASHELDVLVKVSSTTVHSLLVNYEHSFSALQSIF